MPEWQTMRVQMDILCPLDCAGCSMVANVVFIFDAHRKHYFKSVVNSIAQWVMVWFGTPGTIPARTYPIPTSRDGARRSVQTANHTTTTQ